MSFKIDDKIERQLRNAHYGVYNHSAVQICTWTKKSLHDEGYCYKQKFYGIQSHRCMEFSPSAAFCELNCIFCWRPMEFMRFRFLSSKEVDEPKVIYEKLLAERKKLLSGFPGDGKTNMKKFEESQTPTHFAISLSGEPTLYPKLPELVEFLRSLPQTKSIFIVSNGQEPKIIKKLLNSPPTQLYISVNAPDATVFKKICRPVYKDAWSRFLKSLEIMSKMKTRRTLRLTMIKGFNMDEKYVKSYAKLIKKSKAHFIEVKAFMWIGFSRKRLKQENMPLHNEIRKFAEKLAKESNLEIIDEKEDSRVVLLSSTNAPDRFIKKP
ncbi:MAG: 4-demethylwyosine synthase TYW1 [Candidatus Aenigmatarchaeota archaeon]